MDTKEIITRLHQMKSLIKKKYKADIIGVFGSYVREEASSDSDIDILVEFDPEADMFDLMGLDIFIEEELKNRVDLVPRRALREELRETIIAETIPV